MTIKMNGKLVEEFLFPGGEVQVRVADVGEVTRVEIEALLHSSNAIMSLLLTVDALRRSNPEILIDLQVPYMPYARQDRVCSNGEALSINVMAGLINSLQCALVTLYDPHSDVAPALINRSKIVPVEEIIEKSRLADFIRTNNSLLIIPDAGAHKKVTNVAKRLASDIYTPRLVQAGKERDAVTGVITGTEVYGDVAGQDVLIIDDICDGGQTFIALSKRLKEKNAKKIYLYVTHGIFSKGLEILQPHFDKIFCRFPFELGNHTDGILEVLADHA